MKKLVIIFLAFILITGCTSQIKKGESSKIYPDAIVWNNTLYGISSEIINKDELGKELGKITSIVQPLPKKTGESNNAPIGSKIYEIVSKPNGNTLAVEMDGVLKKATKLDPVQ